MECKTDEVGEICISNPGVFAGNTYTEADKNVDLFYKKNICEQGIWAEKMVMNTFGLPVVQKT